ncbi:MAG TPA: FeoA family protein [Rhizomicrobium sp.]|nr:FeoA family protein [Rhizomicrobium sp.]
MTISQALPASAALTRLDELPCRAKGTIVGIAIQQNGLAHGVAPDELERRLLEMGFVEGAQFEILHEGLIGRDPIALKLDDMRVALRRREAVVVIVERAP